MPSMQITVSGKPLPKSSAKYYFALNKPKGYICTNQGSREEGGRQRLVVDLFQVVYSTHCYGCCFLC